MKFIRHLLLAAALLSASNAFADEGGFLQSLGGNWRGAGSVTTRIGAAPIKVSCDFTSTATAASLAMNGKCRGLLVVRRPVSANLKLKGTRYSGTYLGPSGRPSSLSGSRKNNTINLAVRWSRDINGDRDAQMTIQKTGTKGLRLRTVDRDPKTGKTVVTSEINLTR